MNIEKIVERSDKFFNELKMERDELKVKLHLLNMETKEEWSELENKYETFKAKASIVSDVAEDSAGEVFEALKLVGEELREGYRRIRRSM